MTLLAISRTLRAVSLGVWLGCSIMVFVVAPIVFAKLKTDRSMAGEIVGAILYAAAMLSAALAVIALIAEALILANDSSISSWRRYLPPVALGGAIVLLLVL